MNANKAVAKQRSNLLRCMAAAGGLLGIILTSGCETVSASYQTWDNQWNGHRWVTPTAPPCPPPPPACRRPPRTVDVYYPNGTIRRFYNQ